MIVHDTVPILSVQACYGQYILNEEKYLCLITVQARRYFGYHAHYGFDFFGLGTDLKVRENLILITDSCWIPRPVN